MDAIKQGYEYHLREHASVELGGSIATNLDLTNRAGICPPISKPVTPDFWDLTNSSIVQKLYNFVTEQYGSKAEDAINSKVIAPATKSQSGIPGTIILRDALINVSSNIANIGDLGFVMDVSFDIYFATCIAKMSRPQTHTLSYNVSIAAPTRTSL